MIMFRGDRFVTGLARGIPWTAALEERSRKKHLLDFYHFDDGDRYPYLRFVFRWSPFLFSNSVIPVGADSPREMLSCFELVQWPAPMREPWRIDKTMAISTHRLPAPNPCRLSPLGLPRGFPETSLSSYITIPFKNRLFNAMVLSFYFSCGWLLLFIPTIQRKE